ARALESGHGMDGIRDNGNGSLMRIVPLAFMGASEADVRNVSAITHAHAISISCCKGMVDVATRLSEGQSVADVGHELVDASRDEAEIRASGSVRDTFGAALWCLATTSSYAECVLKAVNLGDDTDTTAAVAGALAGIAYGADSIPGEWMSGLLGKDIIESCLF
ncbi:MAG: ADP-ribosylglycohydrolase family protein, partial [Olsenella sp.]